MSLLTRIAWQLIPKENRKLLLSYVPERDRRYLEKVIKGKAKYHPCFDEKHALFIHIPKAAGRSIVRGIFDVKSVEHAPADWYQQIDGEKFDRYFKFAFVRNPWDRLLSTYNYLKQGGAASNQDDRLWAEFFVRFESFDDFVVSWLSPENIDRKLLFRPQYQFLTDRFGVVNMDFIGRFENIEADYTEICKHLNIESTLPHLNQSKKEDYRKLYSPQARAIVEEVYGRDIEVFGYSFE